MIPVEDNCFGQLVPTDEYVYYDGHLIFSANHDGQWFYVHWLDYEDEINVYLVRAMSSEEKVDLEQGSLSIRSLIESSGTLYLLKQRQATRKQPGIFFRSTLIDGSRIASDYNTLSFRDYGNHRETYHD